LALALAGGLWFWLSLCRASFWLLVWLVGSVSCTGIGTDTDSGIGSGTDSGSGSALALALPVLACVAPVLALDGELCLWPLSREVPAPALSGMLWLRLRLRLRHRHRHKLRLWLWIWLWRGWLWL
jgi:hypothetical protein